MKKLALLGTFFYPWYGNQNRAWRHWSGNKHDPPRTWASNYLPDLRPQNFDPEHELYDSSSLEVIAWQLEGMRRASIEFAISSWWGRDDYTDTVFESILFNAMKKSNNPSLKWALYYEKEGYRKDLTVSEIVSDLTYISSKYGRDPAFLKIDGKNVVFVYSTTDSNSSYVERWSQARQLAGDVYVVLKVIKDYKNHEGQVDAWHQYAPANRYSVHAPHSAFVSPGFWKYDETPRLARDLGQFKDAVRQMKSTKVQFWLVETWNEYHEGTQIEPAKEIAHNDSAPSFKMVNEKASYGDDFIEALKS